MGSNGISLTPQAFHVMVKPTGAICNLECSYCFYLAKESLYTGSQFRMSDTVLDSYLRQLIQAHQTNRVIIAWQGGEPTLMGLDFFKRSVELQKKYCKPGMTFENTLQTNGTLLDDAWCQFFSENDFLIGISVDGPEKLHNACRKDKYGRGTFDRVISGLHLLQKHGVNFNILATVNRFNSIYPLDVYRFFRDELNAQYIQFIPVVERISPDGSQNGNRVTAESVQPDKWGNFLIRIFDEWVNTDVGQTFILNFEGVLAGWLGMAGTVCIFGQTCGLGLALEHNGDLYSCDHFVDLHHKLGNILETSLLDMVSSESQRIFGREKRDNLPQYCRSCKYISMCNGECPKNRFYRAPGGQPGLNYLCEGYQAFFKYTESQMKIMASLLKNGRPTADIMPILANHKISELKFFSQSGRNEPCPCGSGLKFKKCHGK
jgi:uncharacterized protein